MMLLIGCGVFIGIFFVTGIFLWGYFKGKKNGELENIENEIDDAVKTKQNINDRLDDDIDAVHKRMRKYTRD